MSNQFHKNLVFASLLLVFVVGVQLIPSGSHAEIPEGYYDTVDISSDAALRASLYNIIKGHTRFPYTSSSTDTWNVLNDADQDPNDANRILDVYKNDSYSKQTGGNNYYNREHSWPKSYGFPSEGSTPYTDCHHLFLCNIDYNGARDNLWYGWCESGCSSLAADNYNGQSGVNLYSSFWETWDGRKGDVARAMFYMDVRYEGENGEPDLVLTDDTAKRGLVKYSRGRAIAHMGLLAVLIQWHYDDPVDAKEIRRNDRVYAYQGNRNPFIDHPEWVATLVTPVEEKSLGSVRAMYR